MTTLGVLLDNHYGHLASIIERVWQQANVFVDLEREGVQIVKLAEVLPHDTNDRTLWKFCQDQHCLLVTDDRSGRDPDGLQCVIDECAQLDSLPVLTPGNRERVLKDSEYQRCVCLSIADVIVDVIWFGKFLGEGRVFLPLPQYLSP